MVEELVEATPFPVSALLLLRRRRCGQHECSALWRRSS